MSTEPAAPRIGARSWQSVTHLTSDIGNRRVEAALAASKLPSSDLLEFNKSFRFLFPCGSPSCLQIPYHGTPWTINNARILLLCFHEKKKVVHQGALLPPPFPMQLMLDYFYLFRPDSRIMMIHFYNTLNLQALLC